MRLAKSPVAPNSMMTAPSDGMFTMHHSPYIISRSSAVLSVYQNWVENAISLSVHKNGRIIPRNVQPEGELGEYSVINVQEVFSGMYSEYPVQAREIAPLMNRAVGIIMLDGTRHFGVVTDCKKGRIVLNGDPVRESASSRGAASKRKKRRSKASAAPSAGQPAPSGPKLELALSSVAVVFALLP